MGDLGVDEVLIEDVVDLLGLDDFAFLEHFEGDIFSIFLVLGDLDFSESTLIRGESTFA